MTNLILIFLCLLLGMLIRRSNRFPQASHRALNGFVIHISLPALILYHIHYLELRSDLWLAVSMPWIVFIFSLFIFWSLYLCGYLERKTAACLILTCGLGNTSFVGLPLIEAYFGKEFLGIGIILDQLGTFLALGTVGVLFAFYAKSDTWNFSEMGKMVFYFPPSQALAIAFLSKIFIYPEWLDNILLRLGDTLTPIALVSIGMQVKISDIRIEAKSILLGLTYKLLLAPLIIFLIYIFSFNTRSDHLNVIVFESGMGPMVTGTIIAIENELNERLASVILGVGILVSILSTNVLYSLLQIQF